MRSFALAYLGVCAAVGLVGGMLSWRLLGNLPGQWGPEWAWALPAALVLGSAGVVLGGGDSPQEMWDAAGYLLVPVAVVIAALGERVGRVEWALGIVVGAAVTLKAVQVPAALSRQGPRGWLATVAALGAISLPLVLIISRSGTWAGAGAGAAKALGLAWAASAGAMVAHRRYGGDMAGAAAVAVMGCGGVVGAVTGGWAGTAAIVGVTAGWAGRELGWKGWRWAAGASAVWAAAAGAGGVALAGGIVLMMLPGKGRWLRWGGAALGLGAIGWGLAHGHPLWPGGVGAGVVVAAVIAGVGADNWRWVGLGAGAVAAAAVGAHWALAAVVGPAVVWSAGAARGLGRAWMRWLWWVVAAGGWLATAGAMVGKALAMSTWWAGAMAGIGLVWAWAQQHHPPQPSLRPSPLEAVVFSLIGAGLLGLAAVV